MRERERERERGRSTSHSIGAFQTRQWERHLTWPIPYVYQHHTHLRSSCREPTFIIWLAMRSMLISAQMWKPTTSLSLYTVWALANVNYFSDFCHKKVRYGSGSYGLGGSGCESGNGRRELASHTPTSTAVEARGIIADLTCIRTKHPQNLPPPHGVKPASNNVCTNTQLSLKTQLQTT